MCFKLNNRNEGAQFARANVWKLAELFLLGLLIGMKHQSNRKKKKLVLLPSEGEGGRTALCGFCLLMPSCSLQ